MAETGEHLSQYFDYIPEGAIAAEDGGIPAPDDHRSIRGASVDNICRKQETEAPEWARLVLMTGTYESDLTVDPEVKERAEKIIATIATNKGKFAAVLCDQSRKGVQIATVYPGILKNDTQKINSHGVVGSTLVYKQKAHGFTLVEAGPGYDDRHLMLTGSDNELPLSGTADYGSFNTIKAKGKDTLAQLFTGQTFAPAIVDGFSPDFAADVLITSARKITENTATEWHVDAETVKPCKPEDESVLEVIAIRKEQLERMAEFLITIQTGYEKLRTARATIAQHRSNYDAMRYEISDHFKQLVDFLGSNVGSSLLYEDCMYSRRLNTLPCFDATDLGGRSIESGHEKARIEAEDSTDMLKRVKTNIKIVEALL